VVRPGPSTELARPRVVAECPMGRVNEEETPSEGLRPPRVQPAITTDVIVVARTLLARLTGNTVRLEDCVRLSGADVRIWGHAAPHS
jgi:hypothetical protein